MRRTVGIRELRDGLTRYVSRVRRGERVVVTDRGKPVAVLSPYRPDRPGREGRLAAVLGGGHVSPAERPFRKRVPRARGTGALPSDIVAATRR